MRVHKQKLALTTKQKLNILLEVLGNHLTNDYKKENFYRNWIAGDVIFNWCMETVGVAPNESITLFILPSSPDEWRIKLIKRKTEGYQELQKDVIFDEPFTKNNLNSFCDEFEKRVPQWWVFFDKLEHICKTRFDINPKFKTRETEMFKNGLISEQKYRSIHKKFKK